MVERLRDARLIHTRNSSGDEIANVNFLYDDIVHDGDLMLSPRGRGPRARNQKCRKFDET